MATKKDKLIKAVTSFGDWSLPSLWCTQHRIILNKAMKFYSNRDLHCHRPWLIAPLDDPARCVVTMKARQLGFTEAMLSWVLWFSSLVGITAVYTMPKGDKAKEVARERLDPLGYSWSNNRLSETMIKQLIDWKSSTLHKHIAPLYGGGRSTILMQSAWKGDAGESTGESTAADVLLLDEYDRMNQQVEAAFDQSLSSSRFGISRIFSTPTYPNQGIHKKYQASDRKSYLFRCNHCNNWQPLRRANILQVKGAKDLISRLESHDDTARFQVGTFIIGCLKCGKEIDRHGTKAEWVAETKSDISGYRLSKLDFVKHTADSIMDELKKTGPGLGPWYWYCLGEAYLGEHGRLEEDWVYSFIDSTIPKYNNARELKEKFPNAAIGFGVDWGGANWYVVKAKVPDRDIPILVSAGFFRDANLGESMEAKVEARRMSGEKMVHIADVWEPNAVIADFGDGKDRNVFLYNRFRSKFYACDYSGKMNTVIPTFSANPPSEGRSLPIAKIDRNASLESILDNVRYERFCISPMDTETLELLDSHFRNVVIRVYTDENNRVRKEAVDIGPDHLLHAANYADIALFLAKKNFTMVSRAEENNTYNQGSVNSSDSEVIRHDEMLRYGNSVIDQLVSEGDFFRLIS